MIAKTFGTRSMARLQASIEEIVHRLLDRFQPAGEADLIADFAVPLPTLVIARLLGIPEADAPMLKRWSDEIALFVGTSLEGLFRVLPVDPQLGSQLGWRCGLSVGSGF
jgi:cytochrome P450